MTRSLPVLLAAIIAVSGCNRAAENKEAVKQGVIQHLQKNAALDVSQLNVDVTDVRFQGSEATAAVSIKPKSAPDQGMSMSYTLERKGQNWEVKGRASGHGNGPACGMSVPPGPDAGAAKSGDLPPGHPPVNAPAPQSK